MLYGKLLGRPLSALIVSSGFWFVGGAALAQDVGQQEAGGEERIQAEIPTVDIEWTNDVDAAVDVELNLLNAQQENFWLGVHAAPIDDVLRSQLAIEAGQGLVVSEVEADSPAGDAGLQAHDILLTFAGRGLADVAALEKQINAAGNTSAEVAFLRGGKRLMVEVTPRNRNWLYSIVQTDWDRYRIGVNVSPADETLRSQLGLSEAAGLVVTDVDQESPASAAGIQLHDVLLKFGGKSLATIEDLNTQIQEVGDNPATMSLLRGGEATTLQVTPALRKNDFVKPLVITSVDDSLARDFIVSVPGEAQMTTGQLELVYDASQSADAGVETETNDADAALRELIEQIKQLSERIDALEQSMRKAQTEE